MKKIISSLVLGTLVSPLVLTAQATVIPTGFFGGSTIATGSNHKVLHRRLIDAAHEQCVYQFSQQCNGLSTAIEAAVKCANLYNMGIISNLSSCFQSAGGYDLTYCKSTKKFKLQSPPVSCPGTHGKIRFSASADSYDLANWDKAIKTCSMVNSATKSYLQQVLANSAVCIGQHFGGAYGYITQAELPSLVLEQTSETEEE